MTDQESFDWSKSSNVDRALLFKAYQGLFKKSGSQIEAVEKALKQSVTDKYVDNFRRGLNSRRHADLLFDYLREHDPAAAKELTRTLRPHLRSPWNTFYKRHRVDGRLAVILDIEHTSPSFCDPPGTKNFTDTDYFHLQLDSHIDGYAVGFWWRPHHWFGLRVGPTPVKKGRQWITRDDVKDDPFLNAIFGGPTGSGEIMPISFSGGIRYPEFVVVVADEPAATRLQSAKGLSQMPIDERTLDTFPTILETSKNPWFIAWVNPSIASTGGPFKLSE